MRVETKQHACGGWSGAEDVIWLAHGPSAIVQVPAAGKCFMSVDAPQAWLLSCEIEGRARLLGMPFACCAS